MDGLTACVCVSVGGVLGLAMGVCPCEDSGGPLNSVILVDDMVS